MRITVFTPTYNRGYIITRLFNSLQKQTFTDFEWIVVDDGSTDNTSDLFKEFQQQNKLFPITYVKTENGGKHRAINKGVSLASGELFFIVDSDDYLTTNALEVIDQFEHSIPYNQRHIFGGVCGLKGFTSDIEIGHSFEGEMLDITTLERQKFGISGDKSEVFYTDILRKFPFPEFENENFLTECVVWDTVAAAGYKLRFFNQIIMICEYLNDGLSAKGNFLFEQNPKGWGQYIYQSVKYGKIRGMEKWNKYLQYFYAERNKMSFFCLARNLKINPVILWIRLFGLRVFYRLYR